jgi:molecular chaperone HtpG
LDSLLTLLARSLYSKPDVCIRELLANAVDALFHKQHLVRQKLLEDDGRYEIIISYDQARSSLRVEDSGCGMTRADILEKMSVIGESGTRALRDTINDPLILRQLIGQFGIGLLASFTLAKTVIVHTRPADGSEVGHQWRCNDSGGYVVEQLPRPNAGTSVELVISDPEKRKVVEGDSLARSVRLYGDFLPFHIVDRYRSPLNSVIPVWEQPGATPRMYAEYIKRRFELDEPLLVIPIRPTRDLQMGGLIFIPSEPYFDNRQGAVDIYVRRMLARQNCPDILPEHFRFLGGVVDCAELTPIMSREDVMRDGTFVKFREAIQMQVRDQLAGLKERERVLYSILVPHGRELKAAVLQDPVLFDSLAEVLPFSRSDGRTAITLREYANNAANRADENERRVIYYFTGIGVGVARYQINQVMRDRGLEVIEIADDPILKGPSLDLNIVRQYAAKHDLQVKAAEERSDLLPTVSDDRWALVERVFQGIAPAGPRRFTVRTTAFDPEFLPVLVLSPKYGDLRDQMNRVFQQGGDVGVLKQILEIAKARLDEEEGSLMFFLNAKNQEMAIFHDRVQEVHPVVARLVAIDLYHLAMQYSGFTYGPEQMSSVINNRLDIVRLCLKCNVVPDDPSSEGPEA